MIAEGHADYATPDDISGLDDSVLIDIAQLCEVETYAPDECIPCLAAVTVLQRQEEAALAALAEQHQVPEVPESLSDLIEEEEEEYPPTPRLDKLMSEPFRFQDEEKPVVERFAEQVESLSVLVTELLHGPPIPPPNVSLDELAALVIGAEKWSKMIDAQGLDLAPTQQAVKEQIDSIVTRLRS